MKKPRFVANTCFNACNTSKSLQLISFFFTIVLIVATKVSSLPETLRAFFNALGIEKFHLPMILILSMGFGGRVAIACCNLNVLNENRTHFKSPERPGFFVSSLQE